MNAWELVAMWANDRAKDLRAAAKNAEAAYTKNPMAQACTSYAASLRRAADRLEGDARAFLERSAHGSVPLPDEEGGTNG